MRLDEAAAIARSAARRRRCWRSSVWRRSTICLRHYPRRYADRGELTDLASLEVGDDVTVIAEVARASSRRMKTRRGSVRRGHGHRRKALSRPDVLQPAVASPEGTAVRGARTVRRSSRGVPGTTPAHPPRLSAARRPGQRARHRRLRWRLITVYPAKKGRHVLGHRPDPCASCSTRSANIDDPLPQFVLRRHNLMPLVEALRAIHRPRTREEAVAPGDASRGRRRSFSRSRLRNVDAKHWPWRRHLACLVSDGSAHAVRRSAAIRADRRASARSGKTSR